ncbi:maleylpyruvate isomerase family mycothiol-dependent enzyme [Blastococcus sp. CT_GayMR20]|uniref:maleylpyruvate isomerase family mycothiol-dependent enzyme n=1 Tax=Blastococcus sp. CT_GayMR20 TaxID=2559609 RepID=UPI0010743D60|nr:maleylpyruvate isomerase family mycothiol-dependent enzyme [Blastococcus sp. CT_GayMR20]TFV65280.1 maleylpyruvate isomerase family mycothiol-dependent enzyme [Blastococcus sp. CT_GayMR20]
MAAGTTVHPPSRRPSSRRAVLDRDTARRLAATEYARVAALLRSLAPEDWARPTDCAGWDVRAMAGHVLGMTEMAATLRAAVAQNVAASRAGGGIDALTALQVRRSAGLSATELVERFAAVAPRAERGRHRMATLIGRLTVPEDQVVGGRTERWTFGFLFDVILTRDPWMHRVDISRAVGRELELTPEHDGVLVADVVAEWASRHGRPYRLRLTGPAGGEWSAEGAHADVLELDAVEFCRALSGRGTASPPLGQHVPF